MQCVLCVHTEVHCSQYVIVYSIITLYQPKLQLSLLSSPQGVPTSDYYSDVPEQKGDSQGKEEDEGTPVDVPVTDVQEPEVLPGDSEMDPVDEVQESVEKNSEDTADLKVGQSNDLEETTEDNKKAPGVSEHRYMYLHM